METIRVQIEVPDSLAEDEPEDEAFKAFLEDLATAIGLAKTVRGLEDDLAAAKRTIAKHDALIDRVVLKKPSRGRAQTSYRR